jgi:cell division septation protein DedD
LGCALFDAACPLTRRSLVPKLLNPMRLLLALVLLPAVVLAPAALAQTLPLEVRAEEEGTALRYPPRPGGQTASGEPYNPERFTVAHAWLPFGTLVHLTHPRTGHSVTARVNDRDTGGATLRVSARAADRLGLPAGGGPIVMRLEPDEVAYLQAWVDRQRPAEPQPVPPAVQVSDARFTVQLASFSDEERARATAAELRGAWIQPVDVDGRRVYRVMYGLYGSREAASAAHAELGARGIDGFVKGVEQATPTRQAGLND